MLRYSVRTALWLFLTLCVLQGRSSVAAAFYIPGASPTYYNESDPVEFTVNSLRSLSVLFPQEYYKLPFCQPKTIRTKPEIIGETIWGVRMQNSLYTVNMLENKTCTVLPKCDIVENSNNVRKNIDMLQKYIENEYRGFMSIDNLPIFNDGNPTYFGKCAARQKTEQYRWLRGYALGVPKSCTGQTLINNHLKFTIWYNVQEGPDGPAYMVVGLTASPHSVRHYADGSDCQEDFDLRNAYGAPLTVDDVKEGQSVVWSYSVTWLPSNVLWATRWDAYLSSSVADSIPLFHWICMGSSLVVVLISGLSVATILLRLLHRDYNRYNSSDPEDLQEETGWKLVHADVFRPPDHAPLLAAMVGNGYQILFMVVGTLFFAVLGYLSPSRRGALLTCVLLLFVGMSFVAGYVCGFLLKYFNQQEWKHVFLCGGAFPGGVCGVYLFTNFIRMSHGSSDTASFGLILVLMMLLFVFSIPLTVLGAAAAFHQPPVENPVRVGRLPREIPRQEWTTQVSYLLLVPPVLPFFTVVLEVYFIFQALWAGQVFYAFGFLTLVFIIWVMACVLVTLFHLYYVLCHENHRWWWLAAAIPGSFGAHFFLFSVIFFFKQLTITTGASTLLYFLYMAIASYAYGIAAAAIGITSGIIFVRTIYSNIKVS